MVNDKSLTPPLSPAAERTPIRGTGRMLVMDDDAMIRDVLHKALTALGYDVVCAQEGSETVALYEQAMKSDQPFNAVIMDLVIPNGMGGKEAMIKLLNIDPKVKAIVSSGYSDDPIMAQFSECGFIDAASKPYSIAVLSETVHRVLSK